MDFIDTNRLIKLFDDAFKLPIISDYYHLGPFRGYVKQLNVDDLDSRSLNILNDCFPMFASLQNVAEFMKKSNVESSISSTGTIFSSTGRYRRYAGDGLLPGGRYYSVCTDSSGNDEGTMVRELMTYWNRSSTKFPTLLDSTIDPKKAAALRDDINTLNNPHLRLDNNQPFLFLQANEIVPVTEAEFRRGNATAAILPLHIKEVEIDSVVDMRHLIIQDVISSVIGTLEAEAGRSERNEMLTLKQSPENFADILPTLLSPNPGGTTFHNLIGAICRNAGANGLVFPSSRRNVSVSSDLNGVIYNHSGWNFVDYRGAGYVDSKLITSLPGCLVRWLSLEDIGAELIWNNDNEDLRQWSIKGAEEGEECRINIELDMKARNTPESPIWNPFSASREAQHLAHLRKHN